MKYNTLLSVLFCAVLIQFVSCDESQSNESKMEVNFEEIMESCNETFRIQMDYLVELNNSGSFPDETDKTPMCYIKCYLQRAGVLCEKGFVKTDRAVQLWGADAEDVIKECDHPGDLDRADCERAYNLAKCVMTKAVSEGWNIDMKNNKEKR